MKNLISFLTVITAMMFCSLNAAKAQDAGCGLGSMIFKPSSKLANLLAMTTNNSTLTQAFGITSGTSDCRSSSLVMREKEIQYFAEVNKDDLSREMAQGHGEKLATLASLYGCRGDASTAFSKMTQQFFDHILPQPTTAATEMIQNLNSEFLGRPELADKCRSI